MNENHLIEYLVAFEVHLLSLKCLLQAKENFSQRAIKAKAKPSVTKKSIDDDIRAADECLENFKALLSTKDYEEKQMALLVLKFEMIVTTVEEFDSKLFEILGEMLPIIDKSPSDDQATRKIKIYLRCGSYLVYFDDHAQEGFNYYKRAVELSEKEEERDPSDAHKHQLANASFQWGKARVRANRLTGSYSTSICGE